MTDKIIENNQVSIMGEIISEFSYSHEVFGEGFYMVDISVQRLSNSTDLIPVMISERLIDVTQDYQGRYIQIFGQFRSYNRHEEKKNRLVLSVFAREVSFVEEDCDKVKSNQIFLDGYICKTPVYRRTPLGREIADMLLAVNRPYGKSDYIPCICWGRNARFASGFEVGGHVQIWGRIQSREYVKKLSVETLSAPLRSEAERASHESNASQWAGTEEVTQKRIAYEVSVSKMELIE